LYNLEHVSKIPQSKHEDFRYLQHFHRGAGRNYEVQNLRKEKRICCPFESLIGLNYATQKPKPNPNLAILK